MKKFQVSQLVSDSLKALFRYHQRSFKEKPTNLLMQLKNPPYKFDEKDIPIICSNTNISHKRNPPFNRSVAYIDDLYVVVSLDEGEVGKLQGEEVLDDLMRYYSVCEYLEEPNTISISVSETATQNYNYFVRDVEEARKDIEKALHKLGITSYKVSYRVDCIRIYSSRYSYERKGKTTKEIQRPAVDPKALKDNIEQIYKFRGEESPITHVSYHYWDGAYRYMIGVPETEFDDVHSMYNFAQGEYKFIENIIEDLYKY